MTTALPKDINVNLDDLEREESYKPFAIQLGGRRIEMVDPAEIDWQDLLEIENPVYFLRYALSEEKPEDEELSDKDFFKAQKIPGWKLGKIIELYTKHYGLDKPGNAVASRI